MEILDNFRIQFKYQFNNYSMLIQVKVNTYCFSCKSRFSEDLPEIVSEIFDI